MQLTCLQTLSEDNNSSADTCKIGMQVKEVSMAELLQHVEMNLMQTHLRERLKQRLATAAAAAADVEVQGEGP